MSGVVTNPKGSCGVTVSTSASASGRSAVEVRTSVGISWLDVLILVAVLPAHINTITRPV